MTAEINSKHRSIQEQTAEIKEYRSENKRLEFQLKKAKREAVGYQLLNQLKDGKLREYATQLFGYQGNRKIASIWDFHREIRAAIVAPEPTGLDIRLVTILKAELDKFKETAPVSPGSENMQLHLLVDTFVEAFKRYGADQRAERAQISKQTKVLQKKGRDLDQMLYKVQKNPVRQASLAVVESIMDVIRKELSGLDSIKPSFNQSEVVTEASPRDLKHSPRSLFKHEHQGELASGYQPVHLQDLNKLPGLSPSQNTFLAARIANNRTVLNKIAECLSAVETDLSKNTTPATGIGPAIPTLGLKPRMNMNNGGIQVPPLKLSGRHQIFLTTRSDNLSRLSRNQTHDGYGSGRAESPDTTREVLIDQSDVAVPREHSTSKSAAKPPAEYPVVSIQKNLQVQMMVGLEAPENHKGHSLRRLQGHLTEDDKALQHRTTKAGARTDDGASSNRPFRAAKSVLRQFNRSFDLGDGKGLGRSIGEEVYMMLDREYFKKKGRR